MKVLRVLCVLVAFGVTVSAVQAPEAKPPTPLSDVQKLTIFLEAKDVDIAKLNVERWSREYQLALEKLNKSLASAHVKDWRLNEKLEYVKQEPVAPMP